MGLITLFKDIRDITNPYYREVGYALDRIKNGKSRELIQKIRVEGDKDVRNELKQKLPCVLWSGEFVKRNMSGLLKHSGLICLDFDHMDNRAELAADKYIMACWLSPSGEGVKALVKVPIHDHQGSFRALQKRYPEIDRACKDVSRVCYESWDPDIYINFESEVFEDTVDVPAYVPGEKSDNPVEDSEKKYELIKKWMENKGERFYQDNRNNFLYRLATACNRFGIPRDEAAYMIGIDYVNGSTGFELKEFEKVMRSSYERYPEQYGQAQFTESTARQPDTPNKPTEWKDVTKEILDLEAPAKDVITLGDIWEDLHGQFKRGIQKGETTYFEEIDEHFRWQRGELTGMFGYGNHGKSAMMNQLIQVKCMKEDKRWGWFSPEQYPPTDFYLDFIETYVGASAMVGKDQMHSLDFKSAADWVKDHFYYCYPETENPTPEYMLARFKEMIIKYKIDGILVDPFNQLYHDYSERDDKYLSKILTEFKRFALLNNVYFVVIAHPSSSAIEMDALGNYKMPYYTRISGGMMWGNKCDNILCYNRPFFKTDPSSDICDFGSQKIKKQRRNGRPGSIRISYDIKTRRFYDSMGRNPLGDKSFPRHGDDFIPDRWPTNDDF